MSPLSIFKKADEARFIQEFETAINLFDRSVDAGLFANISDEAKAGFEAWRVRCVKSLADYNDRKAAHVAMFGDIDE